MFFDISVRLLWPLLYVLVMYTIEGLLVDGVHCYLFRFVAEILPVFGWIVLDLMLPNFEVG